MTIQMGKCCHHKKRHKERIKIYDALLRVTPNPAVGPPSVSVLSITPLKKQVITQIGAEDNVEQEDGDDEVEQVENQGQ